MPGNVVIDAENFGKTFSDTTHAVGGNEIRNMAFGKGNALGGGDFTQSIFDGFACITGLKDIGDSAYGVKFSTSITSNRSIDDAKVDGLWGGA